jgi:hypothetical protein
MTLLEREILDCEESLRLADVSEAADTSAILDELLDENLLMIGPQGQLVNKQFIVDAHRPAKKQRFLDVTLSEFMVRTLDDSNVIVCCRGNYKTKDREFSLRFVRFWNKSAGGWRVVAGSVNALDG